MFIFQTVGVPDGGGGKHVRPDGRLLDGRGEGVHHFWPDGQGRQRENFDPGVFRGHQERP